MKIEDVKKIYELLNKDNVKYKKPEFPNDTSSKTLSLIFSDIILINREDLMSIDNLKLIHKFNYEYLNPLGDFTFCFSMAHFIRIFDNLILDHIGEPYAYDEHLSDIFSEIDSYASLGDDWDGYGAIPIEKEYIEVSKKFLALIKKENIRRLSVMPETDGKISFYLQNNLNELEFYLEIGIYKIKEEFKYCFFFDPTGQDLSKPNLDFKDTDLQKLVGYDDIDLSLEKIDNRLLNILKKLS